MKKLAAALTVCSLLASPVWAAQEYAADFESGTVENLGYTFRPERWSFVTTPKAAQGNQSARVELRVGDNPTYDPKVGPAPVLRTTVSVVPSKFGVAAFEGREQFYGFSLRYESATPLDADKEYLVMFMESINPYKQVIRLTLKGGVLKFTTGNSAGQFIDRWSGPVSANAWHRVALGVVWSVDAAKSTGYLYVDGQNVVADVKWANVVVEAGNPLLNQLLLGLFLESNPSTMANAVVYFDDLRIGSTLADVSIQEPPDAGQPVVDSGVPDSGQPQPVDSGSGGGMGGGAGGGMAGGMGGGKAGGGAGGASGGGQGGGNAGGGAATGGGQATDEDSGVRGDGGVVSVSTTSTCGSSGGQQWLVAMALIATIAVSRRRRAG